ncbi:MAG: CHASE domain-containing protein [Ramlibacter sp.]
MDVQGWARPLKVFLLPLLVLSIGLVLTAGAVRGSRASTAAQEQTQFSREADALQAEVSRRLARAVNGLSSLRATHAAAGRLESAELRRYVERSDFDHDFPGMRGFGVIERIRRDEIAAFELHQRLVGDPAFHVRTSGTHPDLLVIRSVEPEAKNQGALGFDSGSNPQAREAIEHAIDTGITTMSAPFTLQQDERKGLGWVLYMPIYQGEPRSVDQRRASLLAVVFAPLVARELLGNAAEQAGVDADFRLYDDGDGRRLVHDAAPADAAAARADRRAMLVGDRILTLEILPRPGLATGPAHALPWAIGGGGGALSLALALLTWQLVAGRKRALAHAAAMSGDVARLAAIVERTSSAVFTTDREGRLTWANQGVEALTGMARAELLGQSAYEVMHIAESLDPETRRAFSADLLAGRSRRIEVSSQRRDGRPLWLEVAVEPERADDGSITGFSGIALDITLRKATELRLEAREHLLRTITDNLPVRISYWDRNRRCLFANRRFCEVYGVAEGQAVADDVRGLQGIKAPSPFDEVEAVLRGLPQQFEQEMADAGGRVTTWQVHYIPDLQGEEVRGYFALATDVTELKNARDLALDASRAKTRFLSNMSHEIRTPMNAILGMLTLLRGSRLSDRQEDYAAKAESAARSLLSLLNDVLDFSKIEAGKMQLDRHPFSLERTLADLAVILSTNVGGKDIEVLYDLDPEVPDALVGDEMRLRQILINLGGNAVKFTHAGEVVVRTRLVARSAHEATIAFAVVDSGIGISEDDQHRLFEDYVQAHGGTARQFGGTGLGLGICRRLTELMGSRLELHSTPGRGSQFSFTLTLPLAPEPATQAQPAVRRRVLVVDDNELARSTLAGLARSLGWQADSAASGEDGVARVHQAHAEGAPYDAVFLDWRMPGVDGWEASLRIRALPEGARMPLVVMVTAQGRETLSHRSPREQALLDAFLVKPVTARMLREAVERADQGPRPAPADAAPAAQPLAGLRLLVAEDNPVNQQIARELLETQGARVEIASDGRAAVDRLVAGEHFAAVLMDMLMPVMDGLAATSHIRRELGLSLPIIAMTANAMDSDRAECLAAGMDDHVGKPVVLAEVVSAILRHLRPAPTPGPAVPAAPAAVAPAAMPVAPAATQHPAVLDRAAAIARLGGDSALFERLLPVFRGNLRQSGDDLRVALENAAHDELRRLVHTLKGMAGTMGAERLAEAARRAESHLRAGTPDDGACTREVAGAIEATLRELGEPTGS